MGVQGLTRREGASLYSHCLEPASLGSVEPIFTGDRGGELATPHTQRGAERLLGAAQPSLTSLQGPYLIIRWPLLNVYANIPHSQAGMVNYNLYHFSYGL